MNLPIYHSTRKPRHLMAGMNGSLLGAFSKWFQSNNRKKPRPFRPGRLHQFTNLRKNLGYTLLELVVSAGILGVLAVSATVLFFSSIRGGSKVDVITRVKQNGQFALNNMEQMVRSSIAVATCSPTSTQSLTLIAADGASLTLACVDVAERSGYIASNSARLTGSDVVVTKCGFSCSADPDRLRGELVGINFSLRQAEDGEVAETATADFSTSVQLRSY